MKKLMYAALCLLLVPACLSIGAQPAATPVPLADTVAPPTLAPATSTPVPPTPDRTADWQEYVNSELGYSMRYPPGCSLGPLADSCKAVPPEERPPECRCFLNADDPNDVVLQSFVESGEGELTLVTFEIASPDAPAFRPPEGTDLASWLAANFGFLAEDMPAEPNMTLGGLPAIRLYIPGGQAYPSEEVFVIHGGRLINVRMIDVDVEEHRALYDDLLSTLQFAE